MVLDFINTEVFRYLMVVALVKNIIIFDGDMSSSVHIDKKKDILVLGKDPTHGLSSGYEVDCTERMFCLSLHYKI